MGFMKLSVYREKKVFDRFMGYVNKIPNGCWEWTSIINWKGYPSFHVRRGNNKLHTNAHRISYRLFVGRIKKDMTIHHKCHNKKCVNPEHLEQKTNDENRLEGNCWSAINSRKTHCKRGHEFTKDNTYRYSKKIGTKHRSCKECMKIHQKKWRLNK